MSTLRIELLNCFVQGDLPKVGGEDSGEGSLDGLNTTVNLAGDSHGLLAELDLGGEGSLERS